MVYRFWVCDRFCIFCLIYFIMVFGVGTVGGVVVGFYCYIGLIFCVFFRYSYNIAYCRWLVLGIRVCFAYGVFVGMDVFDRAFSISRAFTNSICLSSMASSFSMSSYVCGSVVFSIYVVGIENVMDLTSFPFLVGSIGGSGWVLIWPLDVGRSFSIVMGWSSLVTISNSVKSIRLVVRVGVISIFCF
jgi:hypothetical protein